MSNPPQQTGLVTRCPGCGAEVQRDRVHGLCPACVWKALTEFGVDDEPTARNPPKRDCLFEIDDHRVMQEIARGGMGVVYRAHQLEPDRTVALKMLLPHQAGSEQMLQRFRLEVKTIAALDHPGILPIYQVGEYEGIPYFTMKLAAPGTLASRLEQFRGQYQEIGRLMVNLADAVHFAHERGVLHRDLKSGNILFDDAGRAYVSDFGLAKFTDLGEGDTPALTRSIQLLGTPQFLPPEVAAGGVGCATTAGDIYSLGAILYELLTGRPPFAAAGLTTLLKNIVEQQPVPPRKIHDSVPQDLELICLKCLAKEPIERYASARELAEDLRRWLDGRPVQARPISLRARLFHWSRRNPALATMSVLLAVAVTTGVVLQMLTNRSLRQALAEQRLALQQSLIAQAGLKRGSGSLGQRFDTLGLIRRAAGLGTASVSQQFLVSLRTEMAGALALPDLQPVSKWPIHAAHFEGSAEFSRDLSQYACPGTNGGVDIYAVSNRSLLLAIPGPAQNPAISFRFSSDGAWLSAVFQDGHAEIHALRSASKPLNIGGQPQLRTTVEFLPENQHAAVAAGLDGVFVLDLVKQTRRTLIGGVVLALAIDPAGERVAIQRPEAIELLQVRDGSPLWSRKANGARAICWSPDGSLLAVAMSEPGYELAILDPASGKDVQRFHDHDVTIGQIAFHPDGRSVISTSWDGRLVWRGLEPEARVLISEGGPRLLRFSKDGSRLAYEPSHGEAGIYGVARPAVLKKWQRKTARDEESFMMCLSPDGRLAATSSARGVHLWDVGSGVELSSISFPAPVWFATVMFHPSGKSLLYSAIGIGIEQVELVAKPEPTTGRGSVGFGQVQSIAPDNAWMALEFTADGRSLIAGDNKQHFKNERRWADIWLWQDADPGRGRKLAGDWPLMGYHLSKDGRWGMTSALTDPDITVWDPATGRRIKSLGFGEPVAFELTPDGRWLLASLRDSYQLVEIGSWKMGARWPAAFGQQHFRCFAFAPDSSLVALSAPNGRVDLRTLPDATELIHLPSPSKTQIKGLQFTRDGARLLAMTGDGGIEVWDLAELRRELAAAGLDWAQPRLAK